MASKRRRIGLALGSGGIKGLAHIGVLKVLERHRIPVDYIAGSSAGALIGAFYASMKQAAKMEKYILKMNFWQLANILFNPSGKNLRKFLEGFLHNMTFNELQIPFTAVTVGLKTGQLKMINQKEVVTAIMASCGLPPIFSPVPTDNDLLADGAILMPVPAPVVREMGADIVVAVNLESTIDNRRKLNTSLYSLWGQTVNIIVNNTINLNLKEADIIVHPEVAKIGWLSFFNYQEKIMAIKAGEAAMEKAILQLKNMVAYKRRA